MNTYNGIIHLEDALGISPAACGVYYTDTSGMRFYLPLRLIARLYAVAETDFENHSDQSWSDHVNDIVNPIQMDTDHEQ